MNKNTLLSFCIILLVIPFSCLISKNQPTSDTKSVVPAYRQNMLYIRFNTPVYKTDDAMNLLSAENIKITDHLLDLSQTVLSGQLKINNATLLAPDKLNKIIKAEEPLLRTYTISYHGKLSPEKYAFQLQKKYPFIELAEPVGNDEMLVSYTPNDPKFSEQTMFQKMMAEDAWGICKGDTSVVIGICDNGIFQDHEDITGNIAKNWKEIPNNGKDDDGDGIPDDFNGANLAYLEDGRPAWNTYNPSASHGTSVASIAAAQTDNAKGMAGVGFKCRLFPIKVADYNDTGIGFGYKAMIYAGIRGFKVLNCSWGSPESRKKFSGVEQGIVDYAVAKDVAIVVAGGNLGDLGQYYPANYRGVLAVGEVDDNDIKTETSTYGPSVRIMAQGLNNIGANNSGSYETLGGGTSYASPVVAGVVALVRSRYPQLDAMQALEYTRQAVDPLPVNTPSLDFFMPGRVNMLKAVESPDITIPSIFPMETVIKNEDGSVHLRYSAGETILISFNTHNYLASATNLKFSLSQYSSYGNHAQILDSVVNIASYPANADLPVGNFKVKILETSTDYIYFRVDIFGDNDYHDFFVVRVMPQTDITTLSNNRIKFSVGDRGQFGYGIITNNYQGVGFLLDKNESQLYKGCLIASANLTKAVSGIYSSNGIDPSDFGTQKAFISPDSTDGIFDDSRAYTSDKIGLKIETKYNFPDPNVPVTKINVKVTNISNNTLNNVAVGYFIDWDLGPDADSNKVRLFPESIPEFFAPVAAASEIAENVYPGYPVFGAMAFSQNSTFQAQAAGLIYDTTMNFSIENQVASLNSGTKLQVPFNYDISMLVGMKFPGYLLPNEQREFIMLIGGDINSDSLAVNMKRALQLEDVKNSIPEQTSGIMVYPNPADNFLNVVIPGFNLSEPDIIVSNVLGERIALKVTITASNTFGLDISGLPQGMYIVRKGNQTAKFIKN